jgi:hypothetical protein
MAKDKEEEKKLDDDDDKPDKELFLEEEKRDPDEAVFAEQAIHHYVSDVIEMYREQVDAGISQLQAFLSGQTEKEQLDQGGYMDVLGQAFLDVAMDAFGGADSPVGRELYGDLAAAVDTGMSTGKAHAFVKELKHGLKAAAHNIKDNLQMILSDQWDELRDLAYEGSTDFIPVLHAYGLPPIDYDAAQISAPLMDLSQQYLDAIPEEKEEGIQQDQIDAVAEQEEKMEEPEAKDLIKEEEEKEATI